MSPPPIWLNWKFPMLPPRTPASFLLGIGARDTRRAWINHYRWVTAAEQAAYTGFDVVLYTWLYGRIVDKGERELWRKAHKGPSPVVWTWSLTWQVALPCMAKQPVEVFAPLRRIIEGMPDFPDDPQGHVVLYNALVIAKPAMDANTRGVFDAIYNEGEPDAEEESAAAQG